MTAPPGPGDDGRGPGLDGVADEGHLGTPGSSASQAIAIVTEIRRGRYQLDVQSVWGSNQGYFEEYGRVERVYRAASIDELMRIGLAELQADHKLSDSADLRQAVRRACFAAEDAAEDKTG